MNTITELSDNSISFVETPTPIKSIISSKSPSIINQNSMKKSENQSYSIVDDISIDKSGFSEENKEEIRSESSNKSAEKRVFLSIKPKKIIILSQEIEKIVNKTSKISMKITEKNELFFTMKDKTSNLKENFKKSMQNLLKKLNEFEYRIIFHSKPIIELKAFMDSAIIKDLMKKFTDFQLIKYTDFRSICDKFNQKYDYKEGLNYFNEKSLKKPRFCFMFCKKENFSIIKGVLANYKADSGNSIEKIEFFLPKAAKINEDFIMNLLRNQMNDGDFQIKLWIFEEKLTIEINSLKKSLRKITKEIEEILIKFNKNAIHLIEIKENSHFLFLESLFSSDLSLKSKEFGLKFRLLSSKIPINQALINHKNTYEFCKKHMERDFPLNKGNPLRFFFAIKGNLKVLEEKYKDFEDFIMNIKPKILRIPLEIPIKTPGNTQEFLKNFLIDEISLICKNNSGILKTFAINSSNFIEIAILTAEKTWPICDNSFLVKISAKETIITNEIKGFLARFSYKEIEKNIGEIDLFLKKSGKINNFKLFLQEFELFHEIISQEKLLLIAKNQEKLNESLEFLNTNFSIILQTQEIPCENPLIFFQISQNPLENLSRNSQMKFDKKTQKIILSSPKASFPSDLQKTTAFIEEIRKKILIKEIPLDLLTLQQISRKKLYFIQEKYQCFIEKNPLFAEIPQEKSQKIDVYEVYSPPKPEILIKMGIFQEKTLHIIQGDIFENPDNNGLLVVPVDENLLFNGGIAGNLREFLGKTLDDFVKNLLISSGKSLEIGECVFCGLKLRNYSGFMLVISPKYENYDRIDKIRKEYKLFINRLFELSNVKGVKNIVMPVLGAGNNQIPIKISAELLLKYTIDYMNKHINSIQEIFIIERNNEKFLALEKEIREIAEKKPVENLQKNTEISLVNVKVKAFYRWSWNFFEKAQDFYEDYDIEISDILEKNYQEKLKICDISGFIAINYPIPSHSFDFNTYQATHLRLLTSKKFLRKKPGIWVFDEPLQKEYAFSNKICEILENFYEKGDFQAPLQIFINNYKVKLEENRDLQGKAYFIQENVDTGFTRKVLRTRKTVSFEENAIPSHETMNLDITIENINKSLKNRYILPTFDEEKNSSDKKSGVFGLKIRGFDALQIQHCFDELQDELNNYIQTKEFMSNQEIESDIDALKALAEHLHIEIYLLNDQKLVCKGLKPNLSRFFSY